MKEKFLNGSVSLGFPPFLGCVTLLQGLLFYISFSLRWPLGVFHGVRHLYTIHTSDRCLAVTGFKAPERYALPSPAPRLSEHMRTPLTTEKFSVLQKRLVKLLLVGREAAGWGEQTETETEREIQPGMGKKVALLCTLSRG